MITLLQRYIRPCIVVYFFCLDFVNKFFEKILDTELRSALFSFRKGPGFRAAGKDP